MHVHEFLLRARGGDQRVAAGRDLVHPRPDGEQQVAALHAFGKRRVDPDADVAGEVRQPVVVEVLAAECGPHRQVVGFHEGAKIGACLCVPSLPPRSTKGRFA